MGHICTPTTEWAMAHFMSSIRWLCKGSKSSPKSHFAAALILAARHLIADGASNSTRWQHSFIGRQIYTGLFVLFVSPPSKLSTPQSGLALVVPDLDSIWTSVCSIPTRFMELHVIYLTFSDLILLLVGRSYFLLPQMENFPFAWMRLIYRPWKSHPTLEHLIQIQHPKNFTAHWILELSYWAVKIWKGEESECATN